MAFPNSVVLKKADGTVLSPRTSSIGLEFSVAVNIDAWNCLAEFRISSSHSPLGGSCILNIKGTRPNYIVNSTLIISGTHPGNSEIIVVNSSGTGLAKLRASCDASGNLALNIFTERVSSDDLSTSTQSWLLSVVPLTDQYNIVPYPNFSNKKTYAQGYESDIVKLCHGESWVMSLMPSNLKSMIGSPEYPFKAINTRTLGLYEGITRDGVSGLTMLPYIGATSSSASITDYLKKVVDKACEIKNSEWNQMFVGTMGCQGMWFYLGYVYNYTNDYATFYFFQGASGKNADNHEIIIAGYNQGTFFVKYISSHT